MNTDKTSPLVLVMFGPTGVGKSDMAERLDPYIPIEIVNMDVGQFYGPLSIGTAKPAWQKSSIPHKLFDIIHEPYNLTVAQYRDLVINEIAGVHSRGKIPLLVGGSGFYLMSLLYPVRALKNESQETGSWQDLAELDPQRAAQIHPQDTYRIQRALGIVKTTGLRSSFFRPHLDPIAPFIMIEVARDRTDLYERINQRTSLMMEQGWIKEVERLLNTPWEDFLKNKKLIGYDDIISYLRQEPAERDFNRLVQIIQQKTRNYAKRQLTFARMMVSRLSKEDAFLHNTKSSISVCNLTLSHVDLYIDQLLRHPLLQPYLKEKE